MCVTKAGDCVGIVEIQISLGDRVAILLKTLKYHIIAKFLVLMNFPIGKKSRNYKVLLQDHFRY